MKFVYLLSSTIYIRQDERQQSCHTIKFKGVKSVT